MTHHWTVGDFCKELSHLEELAKLPGMTTTLSTMVNGFTQKIHAAKQWDSEGIVSLLTKLELSTLANEAKEKIKDSMTKIAQAVNGPEVPAPNATNGNSFESLSPYLTNQPPVQHAGACNQVEGHWLGQPQRGHQEASHWHHHPCCIGRKVPRATQPPWGEDHEQGFWNYFP